MGRGESKNFAGEKSVTKERLLFLQVFGANGIQHCGYIAKTSYDRNSEWGIPSIMYDSSK